jgi:hypothetical protein
MSLQRALPPTPEFPSKEVPQLTEAYRKAHQAYVLASGLLASWELIGITLDTKEKWGIELKSPKAVPLILFTLVLYLGYRLVIEWLQCDAERRRNRVVLKWAGGALIGSHVGLAVSFVAVANTRYGS